MPALPPNAEDRDTAIDLEKGAAPGWAEWLNEDQTPVRDGNGELRPRESVMNRLHAEDPMGPLVTEARRRAAITRRRKQIRDRVVLGGAICALLAIVATALWLQSEPEESALSRPAPPASESIAPVADQPGNNNSWCRDTLTPDQVSGSGAGDLTTAPGVIMRLEYAWYVLRDAAVVRSLLAPDAIAAPEQATRDAIAAVPAGTQHCVSIARASAADSWNVGIDERRPDGSQTSWRQTFTTTTRDGQVRISSIISSGQ